MPLNKLRHRKVVNVTKLDFNLKFPQYDEKPIKAGGVVRYCWGTLGQ